MCLRNLIVALALLSTIGCESAHIAAYHPKEREVPMPPSPGSSADAKEDEAKGSLFRTANVAPRFYADVRAFQVGDLVIIEVEEEATAERSRGTDIQRGGDSALYANETPVIGPLANLNLGDLNIDVQGNAGSSTNFSAQGRSGRTESLVATVPATVQKVLPNGNLVIEGRRAILVNDEQQYLYVSGIVRPVDINQNNAILSSRVAEAEIEFVGRGVMTDNANQGVAARYLGWLWPF